MGQEIDQLQFTQEDFGRFRSHLEEETRLLGSLLADGALDNEGYSIGFEVEAWLVDHNLFPAPINEAYLAQLADPLVVPELSRFNVELNGTPQPLGSGALARLEEELVHTWRKCLQAAHDLDASLVMTGILPTVREAELTLANMSAMKRYVALNEQVLKRRAGRPLHVFIEGKDRLDIAHGDVMLEAATTSLQIHLQVPAERAARYYNASSIISAPMVAVGTNSPLLFGKRLWDETRIPLFEQAVEPEGLDGTRYGRVSFGAGYADHSLIGLFHENIEHHPVLLPIPFDSEVGRFEHLRLHNGTIWRWNRPLVGISENGRTHLRIEHRVLPSGPSIIDMLANIALYVGLATELAGRELPPEKRMPFEVARGNFYAAARDGLGARLTWLDGEVVEARELLMRELLPMARRGLEQAGLDESEIGRYLGVIASRLRLRQNGAVWQRSQFEANGGDSFQLAADYLEHQRAGTPVHEWD
jgi:hypothetical protein